MSKERKGKRLFQGWPATRPAPQSSASANASARPSKVKLDRSMLDTKIEDNWTACIDFGTAFSKVVMVRRHEPGMTKAEYVRPLQIGPRSTPGFPPLMCPSALYILQERIHFGERAFIVSANHGEGNRRRFESPKHYISALDHQLLETPATEAEDPTQRFTREQLLLLLLGFIVFRFDRALRAQNDLKGRLPRLRIARPAWKRAYERAGEALLVNLLARAFILARTIGAHYEANEGLAVELAVSALESVSVVSEPSAQLQAKLVRTVAPDDCIQRGFVPEATAVAAAAIRPEQGQRRLFVIADIGAGTSDFGAFNAVPGIEQRGRIREYSEARRIVEKGGNFLDSQVVTYLVRKNGLNADLPADVATIAALTREARRYKEDLFRDGELFGKHQGELRELLAQPKVMAFVEELRARFGETLNVACTEAATMDQHPPVCVLLTGGGATLPFVRDLARMESPNFVHVIEQDPTPPWVATTNWKLTFRQLAVAVGGAMPSLPEQK
jgi:hypothetical protein